MKKIFISVGDYSADIHASKLMRQIKAISDDVEFIGLGGPKMIEEGLEPIASLDEIAVVGFWEVAKKYSFFRELLDRSGHILSGGDISLFIPVDYPGFNIRLSERASKYGIPVYYYIAPQLWAWGKNRASRLAAIVDKLLVVFPFEVDFFESYGIDTEYVGHPLLDDTVFANNIKPFDERRKMIAFLPGSRKQELRRHLPLFESIATLLGNSINNNKTDNILADYKIGISVPNIDGLGGLRRIVTDNGWVVFDSSRELMQNSRAGVIKTGTSNLEAALCGLPFAMVYKTSALTYYFGKILVNLDNISLVNILAGRRIVSEFVQGDAKPKAIVSEVLHLLNNGERDGNLSRDDMLSEFGRIRKELGQAGASRNAAKIICGAMDN